MTDNKKILRNIKDANLTSGGKFPNLVLLGRKKGKNENFSAKIYYYEL